MDYTLLEKAMALYKQEQQQQQQQSTPDCLHDFEYDSSYGEIVCFNCGLIKGPLLIASSDYLHYTPRSKPDKTAYLKKCIAEHEEQYNCFIPCDVRNAFKRFQVCLIRMIPKEQKFLQKYSFSYSSALWIYMPRSSFYQHKAL